MRDSFKRTCHKKNHLVPADEVYCYRDETHGITEAITICDDCLFEHVIEFYPGGTLQAVLIDKHPEWKERLTKRAPDYLKAAETCQPTYRQSELGLPAVSG